MIAPTASKIFVLGVMPLIHTGITAAFAVVLGSPPTSAISLGVLVFALLSMAAGSDLLREDTATDSGHRFEFIVRQLCVFALPFVLAVVWAVLNVAIGIMPSLPSFVFPFIAGLIMGRAAMEYHYFRRSEDAPDGHESVFYHTDDGE